MIPQDGPRRSDTEPEWLRRFDELAELAPGERAVRLAALAGEQPELAARLERLFAAEEGAPPLLSQPFVQQAPQLVVAALTEEGAEMPREKLPPGTQIGPYRLRELLGRGGMGEVYRAERADGVFEQKVALKLVKRGMDTEEILRRFHRERQILARLEHPGIARILDGGTASDGRPYFVLELVEGEPILAHCRRVRAPLEERLRLVIAACEAVDAAHRNLVVHRDLKPSNLLVTAGGEVKLLDFGIAKLLQQDEGGDQTTRREDIFLTPAYAAPEQLLGEPVTTATDVYALGIVLYELLTGRSPHAGGRTLSPAAEDEKHETLDRPSTVLRRAAGAGEADGEKAGIPDRRRFARRLQGDLDTVVLTALRRDPARRYPSAAALAADLRRFLEGRPVDARPDSVLYRARKLVLRHKLAAAAVVVAAVSLVGGLAVSLREAEKARAQAQRAERVKELLISTFREANPEQSRGATLTAREILTEGARQVETGLTAEPEVRAELLDAIAQIQRGLGLFEPARDSATAALAERRKLFGPDSPEAALSTATLADVLTGLGRLNEAQQLAEQARPVIERRFGPESPERERLTRLRTVLFNDLGQPEKALALAEEMAETTRRRFGPEDIETARRLYTLAVILGGIARYPDAEKMARESYAVLATSPAATLHEKAQARRYLGALAQVGGRYPESLQHYDAALELERAAVGPNHPAVAPILISSGYVLVQLQRFPEAEKVLQEGIRILTPFDHYQIGEARNYLGFCLANQERFAEAERQFIEVERFLQGKVDENHPLLWSVIHARGRAQMELGRLDEAEGTLRRVVEHFDRTVPNADYYRSALKSLGEVTRLQGRPAEALALHRRALEIERTLYGDAEPPSIAISDQQIALDLLALGTPGLLPEARQRIDAALGIMRRINPAHPILEKLYLASGRIALAAHDPARARRDLGEAVQRMRRHRGPGDRIRREAEALLGEAAGSGRPLPIID